MVKSDSDKLGSNEAVAVAISQGLGESATPDTRPRIVASGHGAVAEQILQIAFDRGVRVRRDGDLAEVLSALEIESEIPLEALAAVAEILNYVYRANGQALIHPTEETS